MRVRLRNQKLPAISFGLAFALTIQIVSAHAPNVDLEQHSLTWSNYDGIPKSTSAPIFKFDGNVYLQTNIDNFRVTSMHLDSHDILNVYIPHEAKLRKR
jgi:hypothetical protein